MFDHELSKVIGAIGPRPRVHVFGIAPLKAIRAPVFSGRKTALRLSRSIAEAWLQRVLTLMQPVLGSGQIWIWCAGESLGERCRRGDECAGSKRRQEQGCFHCYLRSSIATSAIRVYCCASRRGRAPHPGISDYRCTARETRIVSATRCNSLFLLRWRN